jgi:peptidoglycan hydrolase CwlO-like protein
MKKTTFFAIVLIFILSATTSFAGKSDLKNAVPVKAENKLSETEVTRLKNRVEEIRSMDKSEMTSIEKRELRKESKGIKENVRKSGGVVYIGGGTLLLIILIILLI